MWIKVLDIVFVVTGFAGLFYLPRRSIYHVKPGEEMVRARFCIMERRLIAMATSGTVLTTVFGRTLPVINQALPAQSWFQLKLAFPDGLLACPVRCRRWIQLLKAGSLAADTK